MLVAHNLCLGNLRKVCGRDREGLTTVRVQISGGVGRHDCLLLGRADLVQHLERAA